MIFYTTILLLNNQIEEEIDEKIDVLLHLNSSLQGTENFHY
jgi:hypothetical protein